MDFFNRKSTYFKIGPDVSHTLKSFTFLVSGTLSGDRKMEEHFHGEAVRQYDVSSHQAFKRNKKNKNKTQTNNNYYLRTL